MIPWNDDDDQSAIRKPHLQQIASDLKRKRDGNWSLAQHGTPPGSSSSHFAPHTPSRKQLYRLMICGACLAQGYLSQGTATSHVIEEAHELLQADGFCWVSHQLLTSLQDWYATLSLCLRNTDCPLVLDNEGLVYLHSVASNYCPLHSRSLNQTAQ